MNTHPAPAKINLGLHVVRLRPDGYRDLRTIFLRIPWHDDVSVEAADTLSLSCSDPALPIDESNLCLRAARALRDAAGVGLGAHIHLEKRIPSGAGLGGGSSDAATTLLLLSELWGLEMPVDRLMMVAARIGSDVPFFLGPTAAVGEGRGEVLTPFTGADGEPYVLPFPVCVVVPPVAVSTAEAYGLVTPRQALGLRWGADLLEDVVRSNDPDRWRRELVNDFEAPVLARHPEIAAVKQMLLDAGARYAALSGSGSAVFGVFDNVANARAAADAAAVQGLAVWEGVIGDGGYRHSHT